METVVSLGNARAEGDRAAERRMSAVSEYVVFDRHVLNRTGLEPVIRVSREVQSAVGIVKFAVLDDRLARNGDQETSRAVFTRMDVLYVQKRRNFCPVFYCQTFAHITGQVLFEFQNEGAAVFRIFGFIIVYGKDQNVFRIEP